MFVFLLNLQHSTGTCADIANIFFIITKHSTLHNRTAQSKISMWQRQLFFLNRNISLQNQPVYTGSSVADRIADPGSTTLIRHNNLPYQSKTTVPNADNETSWSDTDTNTNGTVEEKTRRKID
jgi:hypothetical protein